MPNIKSAIRRVRKSRKQASVNRIRKSKYKSAVKQMSIYLNSGKIKEAKSFLPKFHSQLMKIAKTGIISKKTASRKISRITKKISKSKEEGWSDDMSDHKTWIQTLINDVRTNNLTTIAIEDMQVCNRMWKLYA